MNKVYNRHTPFISSIIERREVSGPKSDKITLHLAFDLKGSGIHYLCGDSIGVIPQHAESLVQKTLDTLQLAKNESVVPKGATDGVSLETYLTTHANITTVSSKLLMHVASRQHHPQKKEQLNWLLKEENGEECKQYLQHFEVWDFLQEHHEVRLQPQEIVDCLMPLLPRFYSIASSQKVVGDEVHITIAPIEYESRGHPRKGVCTHYLCDMVSIGRREVPIFIQSAHTFRLPEDPHAPMIMVGPGTGVAPFRAFVQERMHHLNSKGKHWLFFGGRKRESDFFYEEEWMQWEKRGNFKVDAAFSRDQERKVYVQDKMLEYGNELYTWLEEGAYFFVCGDAARMAKDVESALQKIIETAGKKSEAEAKEYIKNLRRQKRYLRDVY